MKEATVLKQENLKGLSSVIKVPTYDRSRVKAGIVHIGIGGFHRAHQAFYCDQLLHENNSEQWGICGVALLERDEKIYQTLKAQDGLYTLIVKELDGRWSPRVIGSMVEYMFAPENPKAVIHKIANPATKIVSLTITEGGYNIDEATGEFNLKNPLVQHDLANPENPKTVFGYLTQALKMRKENQVKGLTIQSCDNVQSNGKVMKKTLFAYVNEAQPDLLAWMEKHVSFPDSMVDRITPVTTKTDIEKLRNDYGIEDAWPAVCEPFIQWVIEDDFSTGRPHWENVGAQFVNDVAPFEKMKLSLLNAGHSVLGILGALIGYDTIDQAVQDSDLNTFLRGFMDQEVTPTLSDLDGVNLTEYKDSLIARFANINIKDQVARICSESSSKIPIFILPTVLKQLQQNGTYNRAAFVLAAWAVYSLGKDEKGITLDIIDAMKEEANEKAQAAQKEPKLFLEMKQVFGSLSNSKPFVDSFTRNYNNIVTDGIKKSVIAINSKTQTK
ncbi:mannitol dehydrogenase family protein [uncultured Maribacter sp.]|uniref:mannitol dehydrogenase family protein n=1 Tax=uncultured Maribacter sp. TaxID=431308 RepID=UPI002639B5F3|nr:mannitol dehydrogenase family protein [uncultured Maribacter sp.]